MTHGLEFPAEKLFNPFAINAINAIPLRVTIDFALQAWGCCAANINPSLFFAAALFDGVGDDLGAACYRSMKGQFFQIMCQTTGAS